MTEKGKAFAGNQRISECFVEAGLQALLRFGSLNAFMLINPVLFSL